MVYRDRSGDEIRDIYRVLRTDEGWSGPLPVARDGWHIEGCPVNGPAVDADGPDAAVAWFTGAGGRAAVKLAFSRDGGESFQAPIVVDDSMPAGRADVAMDGDRGAWVIWLDGDGDPGRVRLRRFSADGPAGPLFTVARVGTGRNTGFPVMARAPGGGLLLAWTDPDAGELRAARIPAP